MGRRGFDARPAGRAPGEASANPHKLLVAPGHRRRTVATATPPRGAVRLHGEDYSLVFGYIIDPRLRPTAPVLVLLDTMPPLGDTRRQRPPTYPPASWG